MSKLKLRKYITESFGEHLKNNYGKYLAGAAAGATGGLYAGGQGMLGDAVKTNVQDLGYNVATDLLGRGISNASIENNLENPILKNLGLGQIKLAQGITDFTNANEHPIDIANRNVAASDALNSRVLDTAGSDAMYLLHRLQKALTPVQETTTITEAVHANHPWLDKRPKVPGDTHNKDGNWLKNVQDSRNELAQKIKANRVERDKGLNSGYNDNMARLRSATGDFYDKNTGAENINKQKFGSIPRIISSAKI